MHQKSWGSLKPAEKNAWQCPACVSVSPREERLKRGLNISSDSEYMEGELKKQCSESSSDPAVLS